MSLPTTTPQYETAERSPEPNQSLNTQSQINAIIPQKKQFRLPIVIILLVIYGIALYGIVGYSIYTKNSLKTAVRSNQTTTAGAPLPLPQFTESSPVSSSGSFGFVSTLTSVKLPIIEIQPSEPQNETTASAYPTSITIQLAKDFADRVSAYRLGSFVIIGPKDWSGNGYDNENGISPRLYPSTVFDDNGPSVKAYTSLKGQRAGLIAGSQFFQWIRDHAADLQIEQDLAPVAKTSSVSALTKHLIAFSDTVTNGPVLESTGIAFSDADIHTEDKQWTTMILVVTMLKEEHQFAQDLINTFITQYDLMNK
jgi:hypothetical protein